MRCKCGSTIRVLAAVAIAGLFGLQVGLNGRAFVAEVYATNGAAARQASDPAALAGSLERAVSLAPYRADLAYELGAARCSLGDLEGAGRAFGLSLRCGPNGMHTLLAIARVETERGNLDKAREFVGRARTLLPQYWRVAVADAMIATKAGEPRKAVETLRAALDMPGVERGRVMELLTRAYADLGDSAQALSCMEEAVTLPR